MNVKTEKPSRRKSKTSKGSSTPYLSKLEDEVAKDRFAGLLTLNETVARFKLHSIKGLTCRESVRQAIVAGRIPHTVAKWPDRGFRIKESDVESVIKKLKPEVERAAQGIHKQLYDFFSADPLHTPVLAVVQGISTSADETERIYRLFKKHQPTIQAYKARQAHAEWETKQTEAAKQEPPCESCKRTRFQARQESANVVAEVTRRPLDPWLHTGTQFEGRETGLLLAFREQWLCPVCCLWLLSAPISEMRALLDAQHSKEVLTSTPPISETG